MKSKKVLAKKNVAENVETKPPKLKRIDIPDIAKAEIARLTQNLDNYLAGVVAGLSIKSRWSFNMQTKQVIVEDKPDEQRDKGKD